MGFDLCVLWQIVSSINLKMTRMLAFEKRYLWRDSSTAISMPWFALSLLRIFHFFAFLNGQTPCQRPLCFGLMTG